jgi:GNAT superfamily N-acetyltransferase
VRLFRSQPKISLAGVGEATEIADLYRRAWEPLRGRVDDKLIADQSASAEEVEAWFRGGFELFVAWLDGAPAGVIRCSFPTGTCVIDRMAVEPERSRSGVGRQLAEHAIARARRAGVTRVWAQAAPKLGDAVQLFRSLGFRESAQLRAAHWNEEVTLLELPL